MKPAAYGSARLTSQQGTWLLTLEGEHDLATLPGLEQQMQRLGSPGTRVVVDLTRATFIDCQVVGWLLRWSERARHIDDMHLAVAIGQDGSCAKRIIDLLNAAETIPCYATLIEALVSLGNLDAQPEPAIISSLPASDLVSA